MDFTIELLVVKHIMLRYLSSAKLFDVNHNVRTLNGMVVDDKLVVNSSSKAIRPDEIQGTARGA